MVKIEIQLQLTPEILPQRITGEVADEGKYIEVPAGSEKKRMLAIGILIKNKTYRWLPNDRSLSNCMSVWGEDTSLWKGKKVLLWKKTKFMFGESMEIIYGRPALEGGQTA